MSDSIIRVLAKDAPIKASAISARAMVERARQIHKTLPVATAALGRSLMAASMMGNQLKEENGSVTLRIKGDGPLGGITVVSDSAGNARGYVVNPLVDLPLKGPAKLDVGSAVGKDGSLTVIKDLCMKEPYVGTVPLVSGEIAEDITSLSGSNMQINTAGLYSFTYTVETKVLEVEVDKDYVRPAYDIYVNGNFEDDPSWQNKVGNDEYKFVPTAEDPDVLELSSPITLKEGEELGIQLMDGEDYGPFWSYDRLVHFAVPAVENDYFHGKNGYTGNIVCDVAGDYDVTIDLYSEIVKIAPAA